MAKKLNKQVVLLFQGNKDRLGRFLASMEAKRLQEGIPSNDLLKNNLGLVWEANQEA